MPRGTIQKAVELLEAGRKSGPFCCFGNDTALTLHRGKGALLDHQELRAPRWPQAHRGGHLSCCLPAPHLPCFRRHCGCRQRKHSPSSSRSPCLAGRQTCGVPGASMCSMHQLREHREWSPRPRRGHSAGHRWPLTAPPRF